MRTRARGADHVDEQDEHDKKFYAMRGMSAQNRGRLHELKSKERHIQPRPDDLRARQTSAPSPAREFTYLPKEGGEGGRLESIHGGLMVGRAGAGRRVR
jgi:hypothetical protein